MTTKSANELIEKVAQPQLDASMFCAPPSDDLDALAALARLGATMLDAEELPGPFSDHGKTEIVFVTPGRRQHWTFDGKCVLFVLKGA
jgi:hypothetical protein